MTVPHKDEIVVGAGEMARRIAVLRRDGDTPSVVWLGGYYSDMTGTKAAALDDWGAASGHAVVRFDYSGHGTSGGAFTDGTIGRWLEEAEAVVNRFAPGPVILVGSSMGGWLALLLALRRRQAGAPASGLVLIAPAIDMTERLMWNAFPETARREIMDKGVWQRPSEYESGGYPVTRLLIEEGRGHLLFDHPSLEPGCPVHILHGRADTDVPLDVSLDLVAMLHTDDVTLSIVHDGDHRLSRPEDIALLTRAVAAMAAGDQPPSPAS